MHTHKRASWQSGLGNSLRTPWQPDTLPNTTHSHTRICTNTRRTLPLWAAGCLALAPEMAGRYFARLLLLNSQKRDTNTSRGAAAKQHSDWDTGLSVSYRTHRRDTQPRLALLCVSAESSRRQHHSSNDRTNRFALLHNTTSILQSHPWILYAKLSFLFYSPPPPPAVAMQTFPS